MKCKRAELTMSFETSQGAPMMTSSTYRQAKTLKLLSWRCMIGRCAPLLALQQQLHRGIKFDNIFKSILQKFTFFYQYKLYFHYSKEDYSSEKDTRNTLFKPNPEVASKKLQQRNDII